MPDIFGKVSQVEAVKIVRRWLEKRHIKAQRVTAYTHGSNVFVVIDGCKLNGAFDRLVQDTREYGFEIVSHSQQFEREV